jgi:flagellar M-ring protein FliF
VTAAVVVDGKYKYKNDADGKLTDELEYEPLSESDLEALSALVSRSIGISEERGDQISVKNLQFKTAQGNASQEKVNQILQFSKTYLEPFSGLFKYIFVLILLLIVYKKVISPFAERMLEVSKEEDDSNKPVLDIGNDDAEDLVEKVHQMRKKVEEQLGVGEGFSEDELKYDVLLEKVKAMIEEAPDAVALVLQALVTEDTEAANK